MYLEKVLFCPASGDKGSYPAILLALACYYVLCTRRQPPMSKNQFLVKLCFSLLKVQIVSGKCSYLIFCCHWSFNLLPATWSYYRNLGGILAALKYCSFLMVSRLSLRKSINGLISQLILKLSANWAVVKWLEVTR